MSVAMSAAMKRFSFVTCSGLSLCAVVAGCATHPIAPSHETECISGVGQIGLSRMDASLSESRQIFTVTPIASKEWLILGGHLEKNPSVRVSRTADRLVVTQDGRTEIKPLDSSMKVERWGHRATRLRNGNVFVCGGSKSALCEIYDVAHHYFSSAGALAHPRSGGAQVLLPSGNVLISGGYNQGDVNLGRVLASAELFKPRSGQISKLEDMSAARAGHAIFVQGHKAYVVGGTSDDSAVIEVFDERRSQFSPTPMRLPFGLKDFASFERGQSVYLFGGTRSDGNSSDRVIQINFKAQEVTELPLRLSEPREDISLCVSGDRAGVFAFGGEAKRAGGESAHSGSAEEVSFSPFSVTPKGRDFYFDDAQVIQVPGVGCVVLGGTDASGAVRRNAHLLQF